MNSTTVPFLRYADADAAITWLCRAFGFQVFLKVPGAGSDVKHARLTLETNLVMLASLGRDGPLEKLFKSPAEIGGITQAISIFVEDPDRIYQSALAAGAQLLGPIADFELGGRTFCCRDLEGHAWLFTSHDPWKKIW
jgi:uncharacterized glyoxalase superfamily protein PhnB